MGNHISSFAHKAWESVKETVSNIARAIAGPVAEYVVKHPIKAAFHVVNGILMLFPMTIAPALSILGWSSVGVKAGSMASLIQSTMGGRIAAGGIFATLQSAAMGGYGVATVVQATTAGAALSEGLLIAAECHENVRDGEEGGEIQGGGEGE